MRTDRVTLPGAPLLEWLARRPWATAGWHGHTQGKEIRAAVRRLNDVPRTGRITFVQADKISCLLDVHPSEIWGDDYWKAEL